MIGDFCIEASAAAFVTKKRFICGTLEIDMLLNSLNSLNTYF